MSGTSVCNVANEVVPNGVSILARGGPHLQIDAVGSLVRWHVQHSDYDPGVWPEDPPARQKAQLVDELRDFASRLGVDGDKHNDTPIHSNSAIGSATWKLFLRTPVAQTLKSRGQVIERYDLEPLLAGALRSQNVPIDTRAKAIAATLFYLSSVVDLLRMGIVLKRQGFGKGSLPSDAERRLRSAASYLDLAESYLPEDAWVRGGREFLVQTQTAVDNAVATVREKRLAWLKASALCEICEAKLGVFDRLAGRRLHSKCGNSR